MKQQQRIWKREKASLALCLFVFRLAASNARDARQQVRPCHSRVFPDHTQRHLGWFDVTSPLQSVTRMKRQMDSSRRKAAKYQCRSGLAFQGAGAFPSEEGSASRWLVQLAVGVTTYIGFVTACDKPRGKLFLRESDENQVRTSGVEGAGLGLFAAAYLPRGTVLGTYPGVVLPIRNNLSKLKRYPECEAYIWRFSDSLYVIDPTNAEGKLEPFCFGGNDGQFLSTWLFQGTILGSLLKVPTTLCRINEPPRGKDTNVVTEEDTTGRSVLFRLERDVVAGEELYIDYGLSYDRSRYGGGAAEDSSGG